MDILADDMCRGRWRNLERDAFFPFQQCWSYGAAAETLGATTRRYLLREGGRDLAALQILHRRIGMGFTLVNRGPVWLGDVEVEKRRAVIDALRTWLPGLKVMTPSDVGLSDALVPRGFRQIMTPSTLAILALDDQTRSRMHGKWRNRLAAAERTAATVTVSHDADRVRWLLERDTLQQRARGYRSLPRAFTEAWMTGEPRGLCLFLARDSDADLAAMLFCLHGSAATYHVGWTSEAGRAVSAHHLILWSACQHLMRKGVRHVDLGLVDTQRALGLARFKLGTGARPVPTGGTWLGW